MTPELTRAKIEEIAAHNNVIIVAQMAITQLLAQLDAAEAKIALHESLAVPRGQLMDELQARADAAAGHMRESLKSDLKKSYVEMSIASSVISEGYGSGWKDAILFVELVLEMYRPIRALPLHEEPNNDAE